MNGNSWNDHDSRKSQATPSASIVAARADSVSFESGLNPKTASHPSSMSSRNLPPLPYTQRHDSSVESIGAEVCVREESVQPVRTHSRSTTSQIKSRLSFSPLAPSHKTECPLAPLPPTTNALSPRTREKLLRSARKLSKVLGETPVLSTLDASDAHLDTVDDAEFGVMSRPAAGASLTRKDSANRRRGIKISMGFGSGSAKALTPSSACPNFSCASSSLISARSCGSRSPPVLKVDCSLVGGKGKRTRQGSSTEDADAMSLISMTTAATTTTLDSASRRSPDSPASACFEKESKVREVRRTRMAKLARQLGESVPAELVFPPDASTSSLSASSQSPSAEDKAESDADAEYVFVNLPPRKPSLVGQRKRMSLQLDLYQRADTPTPSPVINSAISHASAISSNTPANMPLWGRSTRGVLRSQSARARAQKAATSSNRLCLGRSWTEEPENAPAPADARADVGMGMESGGLAVLEELKEPRTPLGDRQKALNVRRALKMVHVFGTAPPNEMLPLQFAGAMWNISTPAINEVHRLGQKRHSIHSIISTVSTHSGGRPRVGSDTSTMLLSAMSTAEKPLDLVPEPAAEKVAISTTPNLTSPRNAKPETLKPSSLRPTESTPRHRRRASLSSLPSTPPPFSRYFQPPSPIAAVAPSTAASSGSELVPLSPSSAGSRRYSHLRSSSTTMPLSPILSSDAGSPPGKDLDPAATFRERRLRAAKLARFFGVGYGDLVPALAASAEGGAGASGVAGKVNTAKSLERSQTESGNRSSIEKVRTHSRGSSISSTERGALEGVSVTVQREVDAWRGARAAAQNANPAAARANAAVDVDAEWEADTPGCGGSGYGYGYALGRNASGRRPPESRGVGLGLGRKGSTRSRVGDSDLEMRESMEWTRTWDAKEPSFVRVGAKATDRREVMGRLRELR